MYNPSSSTPVIVPSTLAALWKNGELGERGVKGGLRGGEKGCTATIHTLAVRASAVRAASPARCASAAAFLGYQMGPQAHPGDTLSLTGVQQVGREQGAGLASVPHIKHCVIGTLCNIRFTVSSKKCKASLSHTDLT